MAKEINSMFEKIEGLGWTVEKETESQYRLGKYSPAGQDFSVIVDVEGDYSEDVIGGIYEAYENYDVSYEAYLWLDDTGHGRNGAPYEMEDVLSDMKDCEQMVLDLYNELAQ